MQLRYKLAVVTRAGSGIGREVAVRLSRAGVAVLCVDPDPAAAEETAGLVRAARVAAWSLQADPGQDTDGLDADGRMLAQRARDLGGADLLVDVADARLSVGLVGLLPADAAVCVLIDALPDRQAADHAADDDESRLPGSTIRAYGRSPEMVAKEVVELLEVQKCGGSGRPG